MLISIDRINCYLKNITGVLHVGAHTCEELPFYRSLGLNDNQVVWIEGNENLVNFMKGKVPNVFCSLISDKVEEVEFIITNNIQSSSILELEHHLIEHPWVVETNRIKKKTQTLENFLNGLSSVGIDFNFNFANLDIQGAELKALKGMGDYINKLDYIYTEVNTKHLYKNCALMNEIDEFLKEKGFTRVLTEMTPHGWGDALYVRQ